MESVRLIAVAWTSLLICQPLASAAERPITIRFQAQVGEEVFSCGRQYEGVGVTTSKIAGRDFRFYVSGVRLVDAAGKETPLALDQDGKWQLDDLALLDFENGTAGCSNGTPEMHQQITGTIPDGPYSGLRFTMGVPFNKNHADPLSQPSPLNLTALFWVWNAGHKFARLDFSSTGNPRGFLAHLGSTGCAPNATELTIPTTCKAPNRVEVNFPKFDVARDAVIADLGALLEDTNVDVSQNHPPGKMAGMKKADAEMKMDGDDKTEAATMMMGAGCMSGPTTPDCAGLFRNFGLPFGDRPASEQKFFRIGKTAAANPSVRANSAH